MRWRIALLLAFIASQICINPVVAQAFRSKCYGNIWKKEPPVRPRFGSGSTVCAVHPDMLDLEFMLYNRGSFDLNSGHYKIHLNGVSKTAQLIGKEYKDASFLPLNKPVNEHRDWFISTGYKSGDQVVVLTLSEAKRLWGTPRLHKNFGHPYLTFDAYSVHGDEPNIYHIDIEFDEEDFIMAYRIRGIGISNPKWFRRTDLDR